MVTQTLVSIRNARASYFWGGGIYSRNLYLYICRYNYSQGRARQGKAG